MATRTQLVVGAANGVYESLDQGDSIGAIAPGVRAVFPGRSLAYGASGNPGVLYAAACQGLCGDASDGDDGVFVRV